MKSESILKELLAEIHDSNKGQHVDSLAHIGMIIRKVIDDDVVRVVRCHRCKHWRKPDGFDESEPIRICDRGHYFVGANGYCVYGEPKEKE